MADGKLPCIPAEIDTWRAANALIQHYGNEAVFIAAQRADTLLEQGDLDGQRAWKAIVRALGELQRTRTIGDQLN